MGSQSSTASERRVPRTTCSKRDPTGSPFGFIATLDIPGNSAIECDDAFGNEHHWDLYGTPAELLASVTAPDIEL